MDSLLITLACLEEFQEEQATQSIKELLTHPLNENLRKDLGQALEHLYQFDYNKAFEVLNPHIKGEEE